MAQIPYIMNQLVKHYDRDYFDYLVKTHGGNHYVKTFSCWNLLMVLTWAQLTGRSSLRDIECSLAAHRDKLYRLGMGTNVSRNNLSHACSVREVAIFRKFAARMMEKAAGLPVSDTELYDLEGIKLLAGVFAVDSSTVPLDRDKFPWSVPQQEKGGLKLHVQYDLLRQVPVFALLTGHEERDQTFMSHYPYRRWAVYAFDKAYVKTESMHRIDQAGAYFVLRKRRNMRYVKLNPLPPSDDLRVCGDTMIRFSSPWGASFYPRPLRLVEYYSPEKNMVLPFLTNNTDLPANIIAELYRNRWGIELFFKWVKQHLRITEFFGTSANAVHMQIYVAMAVYCMLAIAAAAMDVKMTAYEFSRTLGVSLTEKRHMCDWLAVMRSVPGPVAEMPAPSLFTEAEIAKYDL